MNTDSDASTHYDLQGYSRDEHVKKAEQPYELKEHEIHSLDEINEVLNSKKISIEKLENIKTYLEHLEFRLSNIMIAEEREGIVNLQIKNDINYVRSLKNKTVTELHKRGRKHP